MVWFKVFFQPVLYRHAIIARHYAMFAAGAVTHGGAQLRPFSFLSVSIRHWRFCAHPPNLSTDFVEQWPGF